MKGRLIEIADETLAICARGAYVAPSGATVTVRDEIARAVAGTRYYPGKMLPALAAGGGAPRVEVTDEKTGAAARRLIEGEGERGVAALNFASALHVGGGFLGGARAQEEDLCRCSALYPCLEPQRAYYTANHAVRAPLYTDGMIYSPEVPFFRGEDLTLLERPFALSVITAPAPNVNVPQPPPAVVLEEVFAHRIAGVLAIAAERGQRVLILGAWGCGAFGNDPVLVAEIFARLLARAPFDRVVFAVYDSGARNNLQAFERRFRSFRGGAFRSGT